MKRLLFFLFVVFFITNCTSEPSESDIQTVIAKTESSKGQIKEPTEVLPPTKLPELPTKTLAPSTTPTYTQVLTIDSSPTNTEVASFIEEVFALNYVDSQDSGGVVIEISRVLFADKSYMEKETGWDFDESDEDYRDKDVVGMIVFKVTNNTDKIINLYPYHGKVIINGEQIELRDYQFDTFGEELHGEVYPGVTLIGGVWFGIKRSTVEEITSMIIGIEAPYDNNYDTLGENYYFSIDLSNHIFETLPDELK